MPRLMEVVMVDVDFAYIPKNMSEHTASCNGSYYWSSGPFRRADGKSDYIKYCGCGYSFWEEGGESVVEMPICPKTTHIEAV